MKKAFYLTLSQTETVNGEYLKATDNHGKF